MKIWMQSAFGSSGRSNFLLGRNGPGADRCRVERVPDLGKQHDRLGGTNKT